MEMAMAMSMGTGTMGMGMGMGMGDINFVPRTQHHANIFISLKQLAYNLEPNAFVGTGHQSNSLNAHIVLYLFKPKSEQ